MAATEQDTSVLLVGLDSDGAQVFSHEFEGLAPVTDTAVRGEDEIIVVARGDVYSFQPSTGSLVDLEIPSVIVQPPFITQAYVFERVAVSPGGQLLVKSRDGDWNDRVFTHRYDLPQTDWSWQAQYLTGPFQQPIRDSILADDGPFGVFLIGSQPAQGAPNGLFFENYDLETGTETTFSLSPYFGDDGDGAFPREVNCIEFLEDGTLLVSVVFAVGYPILLDLWTEVQRWSSEGDLLTAELGPGGPCHAAADPVGGAYLAGRASTTESRITRVSPEGDVSIVLDNLPGRFVDVVVGDDSTVTVLRDPTAGVPSVRKFCID